MKKNGFTLAEVLVALGIVGVLSAMTAPTLIKNNQNLVYAKTLSTAVSDFEIAMSAMITRENVSNLHETPAWEDLEDTNLTGNNENAELEITDLINKDRDRRDQIEQFAVNLADILNIETLNKSSHNYYRGTINILNGAEEDPDTVFGAATFALTSKKGFTYHMRTISPDDQDRTDLEAMTAGVNLTRVAAWVFIDVNGNQRPNRTGRDIFGFILGNDGIMYPLGGRDTAFFLDNDTANIWSTDASTYTCTNAVKDNFALGCTARLIDNNYRIDY